MSNHSEFIKSLTEAAKTHEDFLTIVRYGLQQLLADQQLLLKVIFADAAREVGRSGGELSMSAAAAHTFEELGLRILFEPRAGDVTDKPFGFSLDDARRLRDIIDRALASANAHTSQNDDFEPDEQLDKDMQLLTDLQEARLLLHQVTGGAA